MEIAVALFLWWLSGFLPALWCLSAINRYVARIYPYREADPIKRGDALYFAFFSLAGPVFGTVSVVFAVIRECSNRSWSPKFDLSDWLRQPLFPQRRK